MTIKKYPAYKDSGVEWLGEIPAGWEVRPGFTIVTERKEKNIGLKENTVLSLSYGSVIIKPEEKLTGLVPESFETYQLVYPGDIIIRPTDLQNDHVSLRTGLAKDKGIITSAYINLNVHTDYNERFYHYFLHSIDTNKVIYGLGSGLRQNLSYDDFKRFPFITPSLAEQTAIANFLDEKTAKIETAIAQKEQLIALLRERKQIIIQTAVTKGLDPSVKMKDSGVEWIGEIPAGWEVKRLKYVFDFIQTGTTPPTSNQNYFDGDINWFNPKDLNNQILEKSKKSISQLAIKRGEIKLFKADSVLIVGIGATTGKTSYMPKKGTFNQQITGFHSSNEFNRYYFYLLQSLSSVMLNVASYTTLPILNNEFFKSFKIIILPFAEQHAIVAHIESKSAKIEEAIRLQQAQIGKLKEYKAILINNAVTGKMMVC